ncbi:MAG: hypothetical protein PHH75_06070 [Candidatus Omnitrophica bacterium]|nr:hypothetical protein [Candidatus Omnitrophota bacterium]MDD5574729.1 hypothetical protein [Candidatus Omnitrophota bacterium]
MNKTCSMILSFWLLCGTAFAEPAVLHDHTGGALPAQMQGFYGEYTERREASGTSWQPDSTPAEGVHFFHKDWAIMAHGFVNAIYTHQGSDRGGEEVFSTSMFMATGRRSLGKGRFGLRGMFSLDPLMGKDGYPLLLQTGETADGEHPLIDRQHPHDLFMECAVTYSIPAGRDEDSFFAYFGLPGEPALGPPAFMHRFSGMDNPEAPLSHHWLDSTHITFGVLTLGYVLNNNIKCEGSIFRGREPDQDRWDMEEPKFDSYSFRLSFNPSANWSFQASFGHLDSPEQLEPNVDMNRTTVSLIWNKPFESGNWQTTLAWGRNRKFPGKATDAFLLESAINVHRAHTFFGRAECVEKDELFEQGDPLAGRAYTVMKVGGGYIYDFFEWENIDFGLGGEINVSFVPKELDGVYGRRPVSFLVFLRAKL